MEEKAPYDGIWLDMNEATSFCVGSCGEYNLSLGPVHPPFPLPGEPDNKDNEYPEGFDITNHTEATSPASEKNASETGSIPSFLRTKPTPGIRNVNYPPYVINHVQTGHDLAVSAISPNVTHVDGILEYDVHNLWGYLETKATDHALLNVLPGKRPFIITRSTFAGSGQWADIGAETINRSWRTCIFPFHKRYPSLFSAFQCSEWILAASLKILIWSSVIVGCSFLHSFLSIAIITYYQLTHRNRMSGLQLSTPQRRQ